MKTRVAITIAIIAVTTVGVTPIAQSQAPVVKLTTVAYRVHNQQAMVAFYTEAFGARFRVVDTGGIRSQFGEVAGLTLKFVPIRAAVDFENFPIHQPGFQVSDVDRIIAIAIKHGGRVQDQPVRGQGRVHASIRDPDGNTIELYSGK
jgi:catechol 2,3-dioxygenase-like lactoylglutathione lyase family enzyme